MAPFVIILCLPLPSVLMRASIWLTTEMGSGQCLHDELHHTCDGLKGVKGRVNSHEGRVNTAAPDTLLDQLSR